LELTILFLLSNKQTPFFMKSKALLVGINQYPDPRNSLRGCINDIVDMQYFISVANPVYSTAQIKLLTDKAATKKGILLQLEWLLEGIEPGDQILFHYSGHGAQLPCQKIAGDVWEEKDGLDEIICPYDFDGSNATAIKDNEFAALFARIPKGVHFIWISDSCHAEDLSRDPFIIGDESALRYRNYTGGILRENIVGSLAAGAKRVAANNLNGALLSACASHELSADAYIENRFNGAFTHYLLKNLKKHATKMPMNQIIQLVRKDLATNDYDQRPQTEGLLENKLFFL
jgi:hypothetical protein